MLNLKFGDNHFDAAITSFCIRNVTDRRRGLSEIYRVIRPGGKLVILELTQPTGFIMGPLFKIYAKVVMPLVTKVLSSVSAYRYLTASMVDFPRPESVLALMNETGFVNRKYGHMTGGIVTLFVGEVPEPRRAVPLDPFRIGIGQVSASVSRIKSSGGFNQKIVDSLSQMASCSTPLG